MKTLNFLLLILMVFPLLSSCEKIRDNINKQRIKVYQGEYSDEDGVDFRYTFDYNDDKLSRTTNFHKDDNDEWKEIRKSEISYNGDQVTQIWYDMESEDWVPKYKADLIYENGLMVKGTYYYCFGEDETAVYAEWSYQYSGDDLIAYQIHSDTANNQVLVYVEEGEYIYQIGKLTEIDYNVLTFSGEWQIRHKENFTYSEDKMSGWIYSKLTEDDEWQEQTRCEYTYDDDRISEAIYHYWISQTESWTEHTINYGYDLKGYMIERTDEDNNIFTYEYEDGSGNARSLWYYPEEMVYGQPQLKNAGGTRYLGVPGQEF